MCSRESGEIWHSCRIDESSEAQRCSLAGCSPVILASARDSSEGLDERRSPPRLESRLLFTRAVRASTRSLHLSSRSEELVSEVSSSSVSLNLQVERIVVSVEKAESGSGRSLRRPMRGNGYDGERSSLRASSKCSGTTSPLGRIAGRCGFRDMPERARERERQSESQVRQISIVPPGDTAEALEFWKKSRSLGRSGVQLGRRAHLTWSLYVREACDV